jgi:hypothetical protein
MTNNVTVLNTGHTPDPPSLSAGNYYQPIEGDTIVDGNGDQWYIILTDDEKLLIAAREGDDKRIVLRTLADIVPPVAATRMYAKINTKGLV